MVQSMSGERVTPTPPQPPRGWTVTHRHGHTWIKRDNDPTEVCIWLDDRGFRHVFDGEYSHTAEEARRIGQALVAAAGVLEFLDRQQAERQQQEDPDEVLRAAGEQTFLEKIQEEAPEREVGAPVTLGGKRIGTVTKVNPDGTAWIRLNSEAPLDLGGAQIEIGRKTETE